MIIELFSWGAMCVWPVLRKWHFQNRLRFVYGLFITALCDAHHVKKPVAWPGQEKISDRTKNCVTKVPGYIVYSVVSNTHDRTNVPLCSGSHKITCSHSLCDSIGAALVPSSCRSAHSAPLHRKQFYCKCGSLTTLLSR